MKSRTFSLLCEVARSLSKKQRVDVTLSPDGTIIISSDWFSQDILSKFTKVLDSYARIYSLCPIEINGESKVCITVCPF